jgi:CRISPR system Cascade subunit CasD
MGHDFIVLTLCAPFSSWGAPTAGQVRPCTVAPTKSGITGFLAATLGIQRTEQDAIDRLAADYAFGCVVIDSGVLLIDYHTMRRDHEGTNAFQTWRHYRTGYQAVACLWQRAKEPLFSPELIVAHCQEMPYYSPYLGRRSCTLALPPKPELITDKETGIAAMEGAILRLLGFLSDIDGKEYEGESMEFRCYWEEDVPMGVEPLTRTERHDYPLSNSRRQFLSRVECEKTITFNGGQICI